MRITDRTDDASVEALATQLVDIVLRAGAEELAAVAKANLDDVAVKRARKRAVEIVGERMRADRKARGVW